jgi:hypothetical protein
MRRTDDERLQTDGAGLAAMLDDTGGDPVADLHGELALLVGQQSALDEALLLGAEGDKDIGFPDLGDDDIYLGAHAGRRASFVG